MTIFNRKVNSNKSKHFLVENELKNIFDSSYFKGKFYFEEDGSQNYLVFQTMYRYFKNIANTKSISSRKSKGLSDEIIKRYTASNNSLSPTLEYDVKRMYVKFNEVV